MALSSTYFLCDLRYKMKDIVFCRHKGHNKRPHRVDVTKLNQPSGEKDGGEGGPPTKVSRGGAGAGNNRGDPHDPNSSDHVVAMTQLKEQIASLQKQLNQKDSQLLSKDRMVRNVVEVFLCVFCCWHSVTRDGRVYRSKREETIGSRSMHVIEVIIPALFVYNT